MFQLSQTLSVPILLSSKAPNPAPNLEQLLPHVNYSLLPHTMRRIPENNTKWK